MTWLLIYVSAISLYDLRTRRIPNWVTLPLIAAGLIVHFPGHLELWLACILLISFWAQGWMGAGDVKLWIALLWALPDSSTSPLLLLIFLSLFISSALQILWQNDFMERKALRESLIDALDVNDYRDFLGMSVELISDERLLELMHESRSNSKFIPDEARRKSRIWLAQHKSLE